MIGIMLTSIVVRMEYQITGVEKEEEGDVKVPSHDGRQRLGIDSQEGSEMMIHQRWLIYIYIRGGPNKDKLLIIRKVM